MQLITMASGILARVSGLQGSVRVLADWVDLQYSQIWEQLETVAPQTRGRLLDVGCGEKPYQALFSPFVTEYLGIEHEAVFADSDASSRSSKPDFYYEGTVLPFDDCSFDTVICIQVLEHTPDPQALLNEIRRVLTGDGIAIVSAPFSFRLHEEPFDYFRFTPHGFRSMFEKAGLYIEELSPYGDLWTVLGHKFNSYMAFRVARLDALGQRLGKMGHESTRTSRPRFWTFPVVLPTMFAVSGAARVLDRLAPDGTETLGYQVVGRRKQ